MRVAVSPSRSSHLDPDIDKYVDGWLNHQSASPLNSNDASGPLISRLPTVFISILAHIDLPVTWFASAVSTALTMSLKRSAVAPVGSLSLQTYPHIVNYGYDIICARIVRRRTGKDQAHIPIGSPRLYFDSENAEPHADGHEASQGGELHHDLPQFLGHCAVSSPGETRFQTPSDKHVLLAAILAQDDEESSRSNLNNCAAQLSSLKANDLLVLHLVLQLFR